MAQIRMTLAQVDAIRNELLALPPIEPAVIGTQRIISRLIPVIEQMAERGYTRAAIADRLSEKGIPVSASTLAVYLRRARRNHTGELPQAVSTVAQPLGPAARKLTFADIVEGHRPPQLPMPTAAHRPNANATTKQRAEDKRDAGTGHESLTSPREKDGAANSTASTSASQKGRFRYRSSDGRL